MAIFAIFGCYSFGSEGNCALREWNFTLSVLLGMFSPPRKSEKGEMLLCTRLSFALKGLCLHIAYKENFNHLDSPPPHRAKDFPRTCIAKIKYRPDHK